MEDNKLYSIMWICSTIMILALILGIVAYNCYAIDKYTSAGYEATTLVGSGETHWTKVRGDK